MKKILLLNPPGDKKYFRDYYCTKVSKADYYYHPLDLVYLTGRLSGSFKVAVIDAIADKLGEKECEQKIIDENPDYIISLVSSPSLIADLDFLKNIKETAPNIEIIATGDIYRELKASALEKQPFVDAVLLDFSTDDIVRYLLRENDAKIKNIIYRSANGIIEGEEDHQSGVFDIPVPRWELFNLENYSFPFSRRKNFVSLLTDFGCAFKCDFCPVSTLGFKLRDLDSVIQELRFLKKLGTRELFIRDQTFGVNKSRTIELCDLMVKEKFNFSWSCFSRVDVLSEDVLKAMRAAGCHTVMFGIESADEELLKSHKKNINLSNIESAVNLIKKNGLRTVGTFILGFPKETRESVLKTIDLAKSLNLDFASFNIATPRFGTEFRKEALENNWVNSEVKVMESADSAPVWINQELSNDEIFELKNFAVKSFYLRPSYILRRLAGFRSFEEIRTTLKQALKIIKKVKI